jgi:probable phosphoglycerate mutase
VTTTVFLVRHGSHDRLGKILCGRMDGVALSDQGRAEAEQVARRLAGEGLAALYVSPIQRAQETAVPIAAALGLPPQVDDDLSEVHYGEWTGARVEDLQGDPRWARWNAVRGQGAVPGGERALEVQLRMVRWLSRAMERHPDQTIAAVGHGDPIKSILSHALGLSLDRYDRFEISPASVSVLVAGDWGMKVLSLNEVAA